MLIHLPLKLNQLSLPTHTLTHATGLASQATWCSVMLGPPHFYDSSSLFCILTPPLCSTFNTCRNDTEVVVD